MWLSNCTHREYFMASRLNFIHWKMVDLDNYMQGNKPFTENDPHEVAVSNYEAKV